MYPSLQFVCHRPHDSQLSRSGIIDEPNQFPMHGVNQLTRQLLTLTLQNPLYHLLLPFAGGHERDIVGMVQHGKCQGDAIRRRLGGIGDLRDPLQMLVQQRMAGEERAGMSVGAHAQKNEVENGEFDGILGGEQVLQLVHVVLRGLLGVFDQGLVDGVHVGGLDLLGDVVQKLGLQLGVV
ncbi:hypothetical protein BC938DRAFT_472821 [Jimgerdemannia flammicorona]|uniref:Uncharacterized protein n=1 Tax=Jimgerdemannia flammicorona TaxID=994334 RepID=A0A433Q5C1_9FUNG|nr:hypothetical protein BC938DRAFT_472821 [Jimgerdemannia flammicorona]